MCINYFICKSVPDNVISRYNSNKHTKKKERKGKKIKEKCEKTSTAHQSVRNLCGNIHISVYPLTHLISNTLIIFRNLINRAILIIISCIISTKREKVTTVQALEHLSPNWTEATAKIHDLEGGHGGMRAVRG